MTSIFPTAMAVIALTTGLYRQAISRVAVPKPGSKFVFRRGAVANDAAPLSISLQPAMPALPRADRRPPLRVVRVVENGQAPLQCGRLMISGRMADVCAELDRMVERETRAATAI